MEERLHNLVVEMLATRFDADMETATHYVSKILEIISEYE